ncbi:MAG: homoserine kinase, partial [Actinobacteria bacterium]|nr:homoserine kinase [Actinomycetota bacterium]
MAKPTFKANPIQVQVPATSANLGPGFDSFGLALGMHDRYVAQILDDAGLDIDVTGEGAEEVPRTDKNLLVKAMYKGFDFLGGKPKGIAVRALNVIPHGRGLGSS